MKVTKAWTESLPLRMQSVLLLALRGPDGCAKEAGAKLLVREYRFVVLRPAFPKSIYPNNEKNDPFMGTQTGVCSWNIVEIFKEQHDEYPHHWLMHFIHAAEIIGQYHPDDTIRSFWWNFYCAMCHAMHMGVETREELDRRLGDPAWIVDANDLNRGAPPAWVDE